jgi:CRISPR-associated protein Cmr2
MSHLIAIAVGPVQEFIAAARRTRDLWFGSYLLSEISRAVARAVEAKPHEGKLIFPASSAAENVANVILAELRTGEPKEVAAQAKQAAEECWKTFAQDARNRAGNAIVDTIWNEQLKDVIEFYAAWVLATSDYKTDRQKLMRLLAGRKNCRDFPPHKFDFPPHKFNDVGIPKSSLDGQRPSVLKQPEHRSQRDELRAGWPKVLRLAKGEELDVVGVTKRVGKKPRESHPSYSSVARLAAETWLQGKRNHPKFTEFRTACGEVPGLNRVAEQAFNYFPFEGTVVFKDRHPDLVDELGPESEPKLEAVARLLKELGGEPHPYLAVLVADGDKMGAAISDLPDAEANRVFSHALAAFADEARKIVNDHNGVLVYAGGDDVLAFLPVDMCLCSARALREKFIELLDKALDTIFKREPAKRPKTPTLSVGIAIGHFMENLEDLLDYGRAAEKAAKKPDRDGLAVHLHKRGGAPIGVRARWSDNPDHRLERFANLMNEGIIPTKLPYELRAMANLYEPWTENADAAIQQDLYRLIAKKTSRGSGTVRQALSEFIRDMNSDKLKNLASELLIARQIATALRQAAGRSVAAEEVTS